MNVPKAIEIAVATVLRELGGLPEDVTIRAWQSLTLDGTWDAQRDRVLPLIDVRCSPPSTDDNQATLKVDCAIAIGTATEDDKDHQLVSVLYEAAQAVVDRLFSEFRSMTDGPALSRFKALMTENTDAGKFQFGGFTFGDQMAPHDDRGVNMIGMTLAVHYGRADF